MARIPKDEFTEKFELGVPLDPPYRGAEDVLLLYNSQHSIPTKHKSALSRSIQEITSVDEAVENCDHVNMIFTDHEGRRKQCIAILPQVRERNITSKRVCSVVVF